MKLAVNYSAASAELLLRGEITFDYFKCPAWPDLVESAQALLPVNVHFPLLVGSGAGDAIDGETGRPADWRKIEALLARTDTPLVNVHLVAPPGDYPGVPHDTDDPAHVEMIVGRMIGDLSAVVRRCGAERVVAENNPPVAEECLRPAYLPRVIEQVIREAGCGLLLDLGHARLAAQSLGIAPAQYATALPVGRLKEIHVAGVQRIAGPWIERMEQAAVAADTIRRMAGRPFDHLPMTDDDWLFFEWAMAQVQAGTWRSPWIVTFEYGGVGEMWEAVTDMDALREQVPRLYGTVVCSPPTGGCFQYTLA